MLLRSIQIVIIAALAFMSATAVMAQSADGRTPLDPDDRPREAPPKGVREMLDKMRIDQEKKDFEEMIERGDQALKISDELEASLEKTQQFTDKDRVKLANLEKLVKKIRSDLGGDDDESGDTAEKPDQPKDLVDGFKMLKNATEQLVGELKKTTRFSISAAAIQSSNAVLRMARFLKFWR